MITDQSSVFHLHQRLSAVSSICSLSMPDILCPVCIVLQLVIPDRECVTISYTPCKEDKALCKNCARFGSHKKLPL